MPKQFSEVAKPHPSIIFSPSLKRGKQPSTLTTIPGQRICRNRPCYVGVTATAYPQSVSMHRHGAIVPKTPLPIDDQTLIRPLNVVVGRLVIKGSVGQVNSLIKKFLCDFFSHRRMMQRVHGWINPKFSRVNILSHAANVAVLEE